MDKSKLKKAKWIFIPILIIGFIFFQVIINLFLYFLFTWPIWLGKAFKLCLEFSQQSTLNKLIVTFLFVLIAFTLYRLKKDALLIFGIVEFVGGIFIIWGTLIIPSINNLTNAIALGAALFLIVQGAENYLKAYSIEKDRKNKTLENSIK